MTVVMRRRGSRVGDEDLARRLRREVEGEVLFDAFSRGRYGTDASIYQVEPVGVVVPRSVEDAVRAIGVARAEGVPVLPRGGGTSQAGQTVGEALVIDTSRHLDRVLEVDPEARRVRVEPGLVLAALNKALKPHGLFFPVDPSTASRATLGGMAANNSCGSRSLRYGQMVHNVLAVDALLADGSRHRFGPVPGNPEAGPDPRYLDLVRRVRAIAAREADEIERRWPRASGRSAATTSTWSDPAGHNMAHLLVGSEGTLAFFTALDLHLEPLPAHKVVGVCHFPTFRAAMEATRPIVALRPAAVEVVDRTLLELARDIPHVPPHARELRPRPARRAAAGRVRGRRPGRAAPRPQGPRGADGRPRLPRRRRAGGRARPPAAHLGPARGRAQHHDVDEGRREAGLLHRGLRRPARAPRRTTPTASPSSSPATARAAPGTPTPPSAACTSARS